MMTVPDNEPVKDVVMTVCRGVDNLNEISTFQGGFDGLDILVRCRVELEVKVSIGCKYVEEVVEFRLVESLFFLFGGGPWEE